MYTITVYHLSSTISSFILEIKHLYDFTKVYSFKFNILTIIMSLNWITDFDAASLSYCCARLMACDEQLHKDNRL